MFEEVQDKSIEINHMLRRVLLQNYLTFHSSRWTVCPIYLYTSVCFDIRQNVSFILNKNKNGETGRDLMSVENLREIRYPIELVYQSVN